MIRPRQGNEGGLRNHAEHSLTRRRIKLRDISDVNSSTRDFFLTWCGSDVHLVETMLQIFYS